MQLKYAQFIRHQSLFSVVRPSDLLSFASQIPTLTDLSTVGYGSLE